MPPPSRSAHVTSGDEIYLLKIVGIDAISFLFFFAHFLQNLLLSVGQISVNIFSVFPQLLVGEEPRNILWTCLLYLPQIGHFLDDFAAFLAAQNEIRSLLLQSCLDVDFLDSFVIQEDFESQRFPLSLHGTGAMDWS